MTKEAVIFLFIAIVVEVIATISLKLSDSFTRLVPSIVTIIGYCIAFWCLTIPMRTIPAGIIYAIWSGVGGFAPIFPDICYHLTHYKPAAADIPVASD
ncbi:DMT family transporter, partial [Salmonella enterica]|uniref:DMT family transporter n=7 Tax=Salmonella enterica TaxID=28901 RepID=UPI0020CA6CE9